MCTCVQWIKKGIKGIGYFDYGVLTVGHNVQIRIYVWWMKMGLGQKRRVG